MQKEKQITMVGLTDKEAKIFIELRQIKSGSLRINCDANGEPGSIDKFEHIELSTTPPLTEEN